MTDTNLFVKPDELINAARLCLGTCFHHQGRKQNVGLDCIGLIVVSLNAVGIEVRDRFDYGMRPDGISLVEGIIKHGGFPVSVISPSDILLFRYDNQPQHVALATGDNSMIHSFAPAGKVVETAIGQYWKRRLSGIYRFSFIQEETKWHQ